MIHSEETVEKLLSEPPDGSKLVVLDGHGDLQVIWRDDAEAREWQRQEDFHDGDRWFADHESYPMALYQHVKYADYVWLLSAEPLARFVGQP